MPAVLYAGIEISARRLVVQILEGARLLAQKTFANTEPGHRRLLRHLT